MKDKVFKTILEHELIARGERVVCGVSGGADSVAMLHALYALQDKIGYTVVAAHLNHGLRGDESDRDATFVQNLCQDLNVPLYSEKIKLESVDTGLEERARIARYDFFDRACNKYHGTKIATAHNANDTLETVLFHLTRGTGLRGLCGIPIKRGNIIRPMLEVTREEIENYLHEQGIDWVHDSSNDSEDYTRNLIRHKIVPQLMHINVHAVENSTRSIKLLRQDEQALMSMAKNWLENQNQEYLSVCTAQLPTAVAARVIREYVKKEEENINQDLEFKHICAIINLMRQTKTTGKLSLPGGICAVRAQDRVYFTQIGQMASFKEITLKCGESININGYTISCFVGIIQVRSRNEGDTIKLPGRPTKTLKKLYNELKIPQHLRSQIPIVVQNGKVIAICGVGFAENVETGGFQIEKNDR